LFKYAVIDASNADRVGDILKESGKDVVKLTKGGWRPSKKGVAEMVEKIVRVDLEGRVVILYGMDNGVYYEEDEDGDRASPRLMKRGNTMWLVKWSWQPRSRPKSSLAVTTKTSSLLATARMQAVSPNCLICLTASLSRSMRKLV
jgi:hypothetical protein